MRIPLVRVAGSAALGVAMLGLGVSSASVASAQPKSSAVEKGGTATIVIASGGFASWPSLDPLTAGPAEGALLGAVYGRLFAYAPHAKVVGQLATGSQWADKNTVFKIFLRHGMKFSDGTPFNAAAVQFNLQRDFDPKNACACLANFGAVKSVTTNGNFEVDLHLAKPFAPLLGAFVDAAPDFMVSPTALKREGTAKFATVPVGAGPFEVQSNSVSTKLVMVRNPHYYVSGQPYLKSLVVETSANDTSTFESLQSGAGQILEGVTTNSILQQAKQAGDQVVNLPSTSVWSLQFDTFDAPTNNLAVRQAIEYATPTSIIDKTMYSNSYPKEEGPTTVNDEFHNASIPGYPTYNLAKAKALVKKVGGITLNLLTGSPLQEQQMYQIMEQSWTKAGIKVAKLEEAPTVQVLFSSVQSHKYNIFLSFDGGFDDSISLTNAFAGNGTDTLVNDPILNRLFQQAQGQQNTAKRAAEMKQLIDRIIDQGYAYFMFDYVNADVAASQVKGLEQGTPDVNFAQVWLSH